MVCIPEINMYTAVSDWFMSTHLYFGNQKKRKKKIAVKYILNFNFLSTNLMFYLSTQKVML